MEETKSNDEILREDKLVLLTAVFNNAPTDVVTSLISPSNINVQDKDGNTALHEAVIMNRWELVPVLLQHGADVNLGNDGQNTTLHVAAFCGAPADIITQMISPHNINMQDKDGDTVLHVAANGQRWGLVPVLLQHGADVNLGDCWNKTPLHDAVQFGVPANIITQLISPHNINMQDEDRKTSLHWAVRKERWELVPVLLQHGADINLCNDCQETPLHDAAFFGTPVDIITRLISPHNINMQNRDDETALHKVVEEKSWELVPVLLQHGADVNLGNDNDQTPLYLAAAYGAPADIISQLISPHNINLRVASIFRDTVLHMAVDEKRWELVPILLQQGADVNLGNYSKQTPLHSAACRGAPADIITQLISPHNINMQDEFGDTVLHKVLNGERWELVRVLLQHGANPFIPGILPEPPRPLSLQSLTIATIRSHMPVKSDEAFEQLGLPHVLPELKLKPLADEIVAVNRG